MIVPNFNITPGNPMGDIFISQGITTYYNAIRAVHNLPYGRVANPLDYGSIMIEGKGTCSTKHAAIKTLAEEHAIYGLQLELVVYAMDDKNTPGVGEVLKKYALPYMLEAHTFLAYDEEEYDYTFSGSHSMAWKDSVLMQTTIDTDQIGDFKKEYHQSVLLDWISRDRLSYSLLDLWEIRQECIQALGNTAIH